MQAGDTLQGRYTIDRLLGQGGMGGVYLATHLGLDSKVAIKEMQLDAKDTGAIAQFRLEAQMLHELRHANLPRVHDFFETNGKYFLVMDYVAGVTLDRVIGDEPAGEAQLLTWLRELCSVLDYLHRHEPPIIFRDLKPSNIMLGNDGHIKLIDFGIAKNFDVRTGLGTQTSVRGAGTPGFAAPEQYGTGTDVRTDVYALGATCYCLLTRTIPPDSTDIAAGVHPLVPIREIRPDVTEKTADVIQTMMSLKRNERPASIASIAEQLGTGQLVGPVTPVAFGTLGGAPLDDGSTRIPVGVGSPTDKAQAADQAGLAGRPVPSPLTKAPPTQLHAAEATKLAPKKGSGALMAGLLGVLALGGLGFAATHRSLAVTTDPPSASVQFKAGSGNWQKVSSDATGHALLSGLTWWSSVPIRVAADGFLTKTVETPVKDGATSIKLDLATVEVECTPGNAVLLIDGAKPVPESPNSHNYRVNEGHHVISASRPGWISIDSQPFDVPMKDALSLHLQYAPVTVHLNLKPNPSGSVSVKVTNGSTESPEKVDFNRPPNQDLQIVVQADGFRPSTLGVRLKPSADATTIPVAMIPMPTPPPRPRPVYRPTPRPVVAATPQPHPSTVVIAPTATVQPGVYVDPDTRKKLKQAANRKAAADAWARWQKNHPKGQQTHPGRRHGRGNRGKG